MDELKLGDYVLVDWGHNITSIGLCTKYFKERLEAEAKERDVIVAYGTLEEMEALKKLMDAAHGNN